MNLVTCNLKARITDLNLWEGLKIFRGEDAVELANCVNDLYQFKRDFFWAANGLKTIRLRQQPMPLLMN
jgi:hypothetical protein